MVTRSKSMDHGECQWKTEDICFAVERDEDYLRTGNFLDSCSDKTKARCVNLEHCVKEGTDRGACCRCDMM